jgi:hypothetical protein
MIFFANLKKEERPCNFHMKAFHRFQVRSFSGPISLTYSTYSLYLSKMCVKVIFCAPKPGNSSNSHSAKKNETRLF